MNARSAARQAALTDALCAAVELVLLNHAHLIDKPAGEQDPELANLAAAYRDLTGWDAEKETI